MVAEFWMLEEYFNLISLGLECGSKDALEALKAGEGTAVHEIHMQLCVAKIQSTPSQRHFENSQDFAGDEGRCHSLGPLLAFGGIPRKSTSLPCRHIM